MMELKQENHNTELDSAHRKAKALIDYFCAV